MGCGGSKVDNLPLVIHCRARKELIKSAAEHRYELSSSHLAYFHSLKDIGYALSRFVEEELVIPSPTVSSPVLTLPSDQGKGTNKSSSNSGSISHIHSIDGGNEDGHLHISSDSESDSSSDSGGHIHIHDDDDVHDHGPDVRPWPSSYPPNNNQTNWDDPYVMNRGVPPYQPPWAPNQPNWGDPYGMSRGPPPYQPPWAPTQSSWDDPYVMNRGPPPYQPSWGPVSESASRPNEGNFDSYNGYVGGNFNSNSYAYYMKKSAPATRTVIHRAEARGFQETGEFPNISYQNSYGNGGFFGVSMDMPQPPYERKSPSPPKGAPPPPSPKWDYFDFFDYENGHPSYGPLYESIASSPDSSEVRKREGIPDLEEETESETLKKEDRKGKRPHAKANYGEGTSRSVPKVNAESSTWREPSHSSDSSSGRRPAGNSEGTSKTTNAEGSSHSVPWQNSEGAEPVNLKVHKGSLETETETETETVSSESPREGYESKKEVSFDIDEGAIHDAESSKLSSLTALSAHGSRDLQEVVNEIKDEFEIAFSHGKEVAEMLEGGKLPYQPRFAVLKVFLSRIICLIARSSSSHDPTKSVRSRSRITKLAKSYHLDAVTDMRASNLSSTLDKLYLWEKKLYKEVKDEERLRVIYDKMYKRLKDLDDRGAEASKIDAAQASIRRLLTKIDVCMRAIDTASSNIHKLRDEELQPQVNELIHGLIRMWKSIVKCHQKQFQAIIESKARTFKANTGFRRDSSLKATVELEMGLINWCDHLNDWITAQKSYVDSLNGWLLRCIDHEPEVTIDGVVPFSPGRMGAPPIFIICNDWHQGLKTVSEERVSEAIQTFASNLRQLLERQDDEQRQRLKTEYLAKDFAKKRQHLRMEHEKKKGREQDAMSDKTGASIVPSESGVSPLDDLKVDLDSMRKKMDEERARHKEAMKLVRDAASSSIQGGIIPIFKALENFSSDALKAHEQVRLQNCTHHA